MEQRTGVVSIALAAALLLMTGALPVGCGGSSAADSATAPTGDDQTSDRGTTFLSDAAGTWRGRWSDTGYNVSGAVEVSFAVTGAAVVGTGFYGLQDMGLGNEALTFEGTATTGRIDTDWVFAASTGGRGTLVLEKQ